MSQFGAPPHNVIYSFKPPASTDERDERKGEERKRVKETVGEVAQRRAQTQNTIITRKFTRQHLSKNAPASAVYWERRGDLYCCCHLTGHLWRKYNMLIYLTLSHI